LTNNKDSEGVGLRGVSQAISLTLGPKILTKKEIKIVAFIKTKARIVVQR
jgi:hypothetical protein